MIPFENESNKDRLERIIKNDILPKLESLVGAQLSGFADLIIQNSKLKKISKDQYLEESRSFEDGKLFFICSGIARTFYYDADNDKSMISGIWKKNDIMFDVNSFQNEADRTEIRPMLEEGELLTLDYHNLKKMLSVFPHMVLFLLCLQAEREKYALFYQRLLKLSVEDRGRQYLNNISSAAYALYKQEKDNQLA